MSLVERKIPTLPEHLSSPPVICSDSCVSILIFCVVFYRSLFVIFLSVIVLSVLPLTTASRYTLCIFKLQQWNATIHINQRLPGARNRSPESKLLSITTQLHCGGHLGGWARLLDTIWKRTIQWLFHQSLVLIELLVPDMMVFIWISHRNLC